MSFTDRKQFVVTNEHGAALKRSKKRFGCALCDHEFVEGDKARWIYCNSTPGQLTCNFFVCEKDDGSDEVVMALAKESFQEAVKLAKRWGIYGPDWQES